MSTRAQWATDRLSAWLQESETDTALGYLDEIRQAVEHFAGCRVGECEECDYYHFGGGHGAFATRPIFDLLSDLEKLLEARDLERAS